ncbi:MAG: hypothetical protein CMI00_11385 [Oceanospirillaceae bacterium]|nr:hypothetical protein [Oceanospirillaceae bacterium]|tara:strand:+ start:187 stop:378 length:192 start_codon:yes stop_codon:yes gene_type:complete
MKKVKVPYSRAKKGKKTRMLRKLARKPQSYQNHGSTSANGQAFAILNEVTHIHMHYLRLQFCG